MRQFTPWTHGVGGFAAHHGITAFLTNLHAIRRMDEQDHKWAVFLATRLDRLGPGLVKVADVLASGDPGRDTPPGPRTRFPAGSPAACRARTSRSRTLASGR
jgi:hypothetical protein